MEQNLNRVSSAETKDDSSTIVDGTSDVCQHNTNAMLPAVAWQEIGADDFAATSICKRYYFRAEQMDKKQWWWSVDCVRTYW